MADIEQQRKASELFTRYKDNPILTPKEWPYPVNAVMNPAAIKLNHETLLLVRVEDLRGFSHLTSKAEIFGSGKPFVWRLTPLGQLHDKYAAIHTSPPSYRIFVT